MDACVSKSTNLPSLGTLIHEIVERNIVCALPPAVRDGGAGASTDDLTAREREILLLVADGLTNARIGRELWVTEQTVKFHLSNIYRKLGVSNRTQASRYAHMNGMVRRPGPRLVSRRRRPTPTLRAPARAASRCRRPAPPEPGVGTSPVIHLGEATDSTGRPRPGELRVVPSPPAIEARALTRVFGEHGWRSTTSR